MTIRYKTVLQGIDPEAIELLLAVHCPLKTPDILDCTFNVGCMWRGLDRAPVRLDINTALDVDVVADFTRLPFRNASFDVLVFDPPHLPVAAASRGSSKMWERHYGITIRGMGWDGDDVSKMFRPFLREAKRVLRPKGLILAKIIDLVHNHRQQWQQVAFVNAVRKVGLTPCDMLIKCDPSAGNLHSSKWRKINHLRKAHCYWIVVRNSHKCEELS